jgi:hypothetical protein
MKKIFQLFSFVIICLFSTKINSQVMAQKPEWINIKSSNLRCWICKERLESYVDKESKANYESGIAQMKFNLFSSEIRIQYYPDRITLDDIREIINNAGFDADSSKATESSYKKLPPLCKRNEDGGGPTKGHPCHLNPNE